MERSIDMGRHLRPAIAAIVAALAALAAVAGCGGEPAPVGPPRSQAPAAAVPDAPSPQAEMVCQPEAQQDIQDLIGVVPTKVGPIQYANHTTTCRYAYANGSFTLVVEDLPNDITTTRTYEALAGKLGRTDQLRPPRRTGASAPTTARSCCAGTRR